MDDKFDRRMRPQREREIYRPGSGPLKRTDPNDTKILQKSDDCNRPNYNKNDKYEVQPAVVRNNNDNCSYPKPCHSERVFERDRRKSRKPDASIYVPKHHRQVNDAADSGCPPSTSSSEQNESRIHSDRFPARESEINHQSYHQQRDQSKQPSRGSRTDISQWKNAPPQFENRPHESRVIEKSVYTNSSSNENRSGSYQNDSKGKSTSGGSCYSRFDRNEGRDGNDKNRGRTSSHRNNTNSYQLPESFNNLPPRLQRTHLSQRGMSSDEIEMYLENLKVSSNSSRDRYPQTTPSKINRNSSFSKNKKLKNRSFYNQKFYEPAEPKPSDEKPIASHHTSDKYESSHVEIRKKENQVVEERQSENSSYDDFLNDNENFNWAEEVEREHQNAERGNIEASDLKKSDSSDKKRDKKQRRRRDYRRHGFSYERKESNISRSPIEGEHQPKRKDDRRGSSNNLTKTSTFGHMNDHLSWRKNNPPSPPRSEWNRGSHKQYSKYENRDDFPLADRLNNKLKINSRINDLPAITKEIVNSSEKDHVAGIIKIPTSTSTQQPEAKRATPVFPVQQHFSYNKPVKQLYNPTNPKQPIIVSNQSGRATAIQTPQVAPHYTAPATDPAYIPVFIEPVGPVIVQPAYVNEQFMMSRPVWYDAYSESFRSSENAHLLLDISRADNELQTHLSPGTVIKEWERVTELRNFLKEALKTLLGSDLKFCETENVEQHMWKIQYYCVIELLRTCTVEDATNSQTYKSMLFNVLEEGTEYFRSLLKWLEEVYKIKIDEYVQTGTQPSLSKTKLVLISAQKLLIYLGELARYKEDAERGSSYTSARQWYVKAKQLNPRNGKPYYQLAILAVHGKKVFDAVYFYMRSLMASNPFFTARESLLGLFDENRKKYELIEKQRRELKEKKKQEKAKEKESVINGSMLRKETWIRPDGRRNQRTTSTSHECNEDSDADEMANLSSAEVYKRFLLSFLHVHGKLYSKVGLETLIEAAMEMLKEFKMILSHSPLPITTTRLIQVLAFNMFAIENGKLTDAELESGYHSAVQESALVISLQMFNLIINQCIQLLKKQLREFKISGYQPQQYPLIVEPDVQILLATINSWCDWLSCHHTLWNPPPSCQDYRISGCGDCWSRLAVLINILEELDHQEILKKIGFTDSILLMSDEEEKSDVLKITLEEDVNLRGFTPLMINTQPTYYTFKDVQMELAQVCLRIQRILFFGTMFLCGLDPPVLKLHKTETGKSEYISVVEEVITPKDQSDNDNNEEQWSDHEDDEDEVEDVERSIRESVSSNEDKALLHRKRELERIHQKREQYIRDKKEAMNKEIAAFSVEMEIKPHYLVPDTNCFIDRLPELERIAKAKRGSIQRPLYSLMIPVIVLSELEGIAKGARKDESVSEKARFALNFLQNRNSYTNIKCVTTKGSVLSSARFTSEEDDSKVEKNDDKILSTCLNLCKHSCQMEITSDQPQKIYREVVLLTEDRNLRVKALSCNMPVETVTDFVNWAGLK